MVVVVAVAVAGSQSGNESAVAVAGHTVRLLLLVWPIDRNQSSDLCDTEPKPSQLSTLSRRGFRLLMSKRQSVFALIASGLVALLANTLPSDSTSAESVDHKWHVSVALYDNFPLPHLATVRVFALVLIMPKTP